LSSSAGQRSLVTRSISPAAFNQKADLASINSNPEVIMLIRCSRCRMFPFASRKGEDFSRKNYPFWYAHIGAKIAITGSFLCSSPCSQTREVVKTWRRGWAKVMLTTRKDQSISRIDGRATTPNLRSALPEGFSIQIRSSQPRSHEAVLPVRV
jgi:hypothetical protein